ncbi:hypothetical protein SPHV1_30025 [Novosphingobium sp. KN65.2]|nr:hypothetical protein SPHV1_30025 [Novosphingobium sp. KN65.2]
MFPAINYGIAGRNFSPEGPKERIFIAIKHIAWSAPSRSAGARQGGCGLAKFSQSIAK